MEDKRVSKSLSEKMCLLCANQTNPNEWKFKVRGQTNNVYEQILTPTSYCCTCPDHQTKKSFCKHLLFLVFRVGKQYDLGVGLANRPKTTWKKSAFTACSCSWSLCLSHLVGSHSTTTETTSDDYCSICFEELGTDNLVECTTTCHKHYHKDCINNWLEHGTTCPNCRTEWNTNVSVKDEDTIEGTILSTDVKEIITDIVISFDTTGSMYPCLAEVRRNVSSITERLFKEIPSLRVAIIAHGDYCDKDKVITQLDFTSDQNAIKNFIENAPSTSGGDYPECYELVLHNVKLLSWRPDANMKSLILIGDAPPHEKNENPKKLDWRLEAESLKNRNIQVFSVQCLNYGNSEAFNFYSEVAEITNGYHVFLDQFSYIKDMIQAICFKQYNQDHLAQFEKEVQEGSGGMSQAMRLMFDTMLGKKTRAQVREEMQPSRYHERYSRTSTTRSFTSTSAKPSLERESELRPSPPSRFQIFTVDEDCGIKDFCIKMGITFKVGRGFYEFTKPEVVQNTKEIVLMDKVTKELYEGDIARVIAGIGTSDSKTKITPGKLEKYRMFIQSTSANRKLIKNQGFLYEVTM
jgi:hypothetical protein